MPVRYGSPTPVREKIASPAPSETCSIAYSAGSDMSAPGVAGGAPLDDTLADALGDAPSVAREASRAGAAHESRTTANSWTSGRLILSRRSRRTRDRARPGD